MIAFRSVGSLENSKISLPDAARDRLLASGVPASINVLESLSGDFGLNGTELRLSESRLNRINTSRVNDLPDQTIRSSQQKPFPAIPAIGARVRYTKTGLSTGSISTIASLDIETAPFQDDDIEIVNVGMQLSDGTTEDLCTGHGLKLPMLCRPRDNVVFLFRLVPGNGQLIGPAKSSKSRNLEISIDACVLASDTCKPIIQMRWKTLVDFSTALNPNFSTPGQTMQRGKRPSSLPVPPNEDNQQETEVTVDSSTSPRRQRSDSVGGSGVTMTLTAPKDVYVGQPFTWDVFIVNRSTRPRKLSIVVIPKRKLVDHKGHLSKPSSSSSSGGQRKDTTHANAVMDENRLYAMQKSVAKEDAQIVCLSTDVRVG